MAKAKTPGGRRTMGTKAAPAGAQTVAVDAPAPPRKRVSIPQFIGQVRAEGRKIVWPGRKETWITTVMVLIMVALAAVFFWIVDWALAKRMIVILGLGQ